MANRMNIDAGLVRRLTQYADLPLAPERASVVAPILDAWIADAEALSRKMSAAEYQALAPATIFAHLPTDQEEA